MKYNPPPNNASPPLLVFLIIGYILIPVIWLVLKKWVDIPDRYLPSPEMVIVSIKDIHPSIFIHSAYTFSRLAIGFLLGVIFGISLSLIIYKFKSILYLLMPAIQAMRSIPSIAIVPFFILWFGFSETGRYLLIVAGISFNIAIASYQIIMKIPDKFAVVFKSYDIEPQDLIIGYVLPTIIEHILPTIRFSLSTAIGLVIVSELLGSQVGLGYLIQTSRSTFAMHLILLCCLILGIMNIAADSFIKWSWTKMVYWRN